MRGEAYFHFIRDIDCCMCGGKHIAIKNVKYKISPPLLNTERLGVIASLYFEVYCFDCEKSSLLITRKHPDYKFYQLIFDFVDWEKDISRHTG